MTKVVNSRCLVVSSAGVLWTLYPPPSQCLSSSSAGVLWTFAPPQDPQESNWTFAAQKTQETNCTEKSLVLEVKNLRSELKIFHTEVFKFLDKFEKQMHEDRRENVAHQLQGIQTELMSNILKFEKVFDDKLRDNVDETRKDARQFQTDLMNEVEKKLQLSDEKQQVKVDQMRQEAMLSQNELRSESERSTATNRFLQNFATMTLSTYNIITLFQSGTTMPEPGMLLLGIGCMLNLATSVFLLLSGRSQVDELVRIVQSVDPDLGIVIGFHTASLLLIPFLLKFVH